MGKKYTREITRIRPPDEATKARGVVERSFRDVEDSGTEAAPSIASVLDSFRNEVIGFMSARGFTYIPSVPEKSLLFHSSMHNDLCSRCSSIINCIDGLKQRFSVHHPEALRAAARALYNLARSWGQVQFEEHLPAVDTGYKIKGAASDGGKERLRQDPTINHDRIRDAFVTWLQHNPESTLSKQAIAKRIAAKTGDSYKTVERVLAEELAPYKRVKYKS